MERELESKDKIGVGKRNKSVALNEPSRHIQQKMIKRVFTTCPMKVKFKFE